MKNEMRVMLVDDEYLAIEDLKTLIDWNALGFRITAAARSGKQALHMLETEPADLIITDISMPNMDGISLIAELKKRKKEPPLFLLLTAYAEIGYMKRAFQLGVEDYLIKDEITPGLLSTKLISIREKYLSSRRLSYSFLQKTLRSYFSDSVAALPQELLTMPCTKLLYCILIPDLIFPWVDDIFLLKNVSAAQIISAALPHVENYQSDGFENICTVSAYNNKILILLHMPDSSSTLQIIQALRQFSQNLINHLQTQLSYSFSCLYSYVPMNMEKLHADYFSRQKSIRARYFLGAHLVEALDSKRLYIKNEKIELTENDLKEIQKNPETDLTDFLSRQFQNVTENHNYIGLSHLINTCFSFLLKTSETAQANLEKIDLTDIAGIRSFIFESIALLNKEMPSSYSRETQKAVAYLISHYKQENLSVQEIADAINLSVTHFSRIFKTETGQTVWDYLTSLRMQKACRLLRDTDAKIYEIAEMTGYSSSQYFSQVFYKQMGMKPLDYRRKENQ